jgi:hypothetical protein
MATTTNYGWGTPDNTDLVKDGALAIRDLGQDIDTTTKALNPETTAGDIAYRSATANTNTRLGIGTAGQVLRVNSGATAPEWATPGGGGYTLVSTTSLSGASTSITIAANTYNHFRITVDDWFFSGTSALAMTINNSTSTVYNNYMFSGPNGAAIVDTGDSKIDLYDGSGNTASSNSNTSYIELDNPNLTDSYKLGRFATSVGPSGSIYSTMGFLSFGSDAVVSSIQFKPVAGATTFSGGTVKVYGI